MYGSLVVLSVFLFDVAFVDGTLLDVDAVGAFFILKNCMVLMILLRMLTEACTACIMLCTRAHE